MASRSKKGDKTPLKEWTPAFEDRMSLFAKLEESNRAIRKAGFMTLGGAVSGLQDIPWRRYTERGRTIHCWTCLSQCLVVREMEAAKKQSVNQQKQEDVGTSLFHHFMARRRLLSPEEEMKYLLHQLVVIASLPQPPADRTDLGVHYEQLNQRLQKYYHGDSITGLLLLYPTCMLHVIESSSEVLVSVLQDLSTMQELPQGALIEAPRVLMMSHDLPSRLFQQWSYKVLNVQARTLHEASGEEEEEVTEVLIRTVLSLLFKLGNHHGKANKQSSKTPPGSVLDEVPDLIVPQDVLTQLLSRKELLSPQQYLQTYHSPIHILMDSERVWPTPEHLIIM